MQEDSLSVGALVDWWQEMKRKALETVTMRGEPRLAPIGSLLYRGEIYLPTVATAARTRHVMKRPAVSLTLFRENELAIIVHGYAAIISPDHADFKTLDNLLYPSTHIKAGEWGEGIYLHIQAAPISTYNRHP